VYCSCKKAGLPSVGVTVSIQKIALKEAGEALGPSIEEPCKNAVPSVPPPLMGEGDVVDTINTTVFVIF